MHEPLVQGKDLYVSGGIARERYTQMKAEYEADLAALREPDIIDIEQVPKRRDTPGEV